MALSGVMTRFIWQSSRLVQRMNYFQPVIASRFPTISFFLSKSCRIWKAFLFCSSAQALFSSAVAINFVGCRKLFSDSFAKAVKVKSLPTSRAGWRVATFRLRAFFRSKNIPRFGSWFAWQHAANANRWQAQHSTFFRSLVVSKISVWVSRSWAVLSQLFTKKQVFI